MNGINTATYDYTGNKLTAYTKNGVTQSVAYKSNAELALVDRNPIYDFAGRRKRELEPSVARFFAYSHKNERTLKSHDDGSWAGNTTQYVYDEASHLIGEYDRYGNAKVEYVWLGDKPVAAIYPTGIYYIVTDAANTPHRLMNMANDQLVWAWDGSAFGTGAPTIQTETFNLRFPGQYYDAESGQHYNLNRFYNPELGRYMEPDPIGLEGGLNPYAYASNNPVSNVDPSGLIIYQMSVPIGKGFSSPEDRGRVKNSLSWVAAHMFVLAVPDNLQEFQYLTGRYDLGPSFTMGGYPNSKNILIGAFNGDNPELARTSEVLTPPKQYFGNAQYSADTLAIAAMVNATQTYINKQDANGGIQYNPTAGELGSLLGGAPNGLNSNSWNNGMLASVGFKTIDPWGYQPGINNPVPSEFFTGGVNMQFNLNAALGW